MQKEPKFSVQCSKEERVSISASGYSRTRPKSAGREFVGRWEEESGTVGGRNEKEKKDVLPTTACHVGPNRLSKSRLMNAAICVGGGASVESRRLGAWLDREKKRKDTHVLLDLVRVQCRSRHLDGNILHLLVRTAARERRRRARSALVVECRSLTLREETRKGRRTSLLMSTDLMIACARPNGTVQARGGC